MNNPKTVEHTGAGQIRPRKDRQNPNKSAELPWEAPGQFHTVPGHAGELRAKKPVGWNAKNDVEATAIWLAEKGGGNTNTAQAYRKESERFIFWLADQGMTISDATRMDYLRYARFLLDPKPAKKWCSGRVLPRDNPDWKPFVKALSPNTARQSLSVVKSLIAYLNDKGWLTANPMPDMKNLIQVPKVERSEEIENRQIPKHLIRKLDNFVENWAPGLSAREQTIINKETKRGHKTTEGDIIRKRVAISVARMRVIYALSITLGARSSDLLGARLNHFEEVRSGDNLNVVWRIPAGKGNKAATLPVPASIALKIKELRVAMGLPAKFDRNEPPYPLLVNTKSLQDKTGSIPATSLHRSQLFKLVKGLLKDFADTLRADGDQEDADLMERASHHWLRHTAIKKITDSTKDLTVAQKLARHSNINTTAGYAVATTQELADALKEIEENQGDKK